MKTVLLLLHDDKGQEARLQAALDLARALDGHLNCLDVTRYPVPDGFLGPDIQVALAEEERARETANAERIVQRLAIEDVPWSMTSMTGELADCVIAASGLSDVIVVNRKLDVGDTVGMLSTASTIALKTHKPVVAVSEQCRAFQAAGHAVVAWDGSQPAMAALTACVPLLARARTVNLVEIQGDEPGTVHQAAAYLSRHDIHVEVDLIARPAEGGGAIADILKQVCANQGAAYCVMGAYGHSPVREALFGGVTRTMLSTSDIPLVLVH
jgi:nucleotide-binding universal stress UspA family protein